MKKFSQQQLSSFKSGAADMQKEMESLGDLAPLIWIFRKYSQLDSANKKTFHHKYDISEKEMTKLFSLRSNIE